MNRPQESGAVSIFIVIFTALLVTIVTTSFIQIMLHNQEQASNNDLSQSAYDSALAGVEDAKRALVKLKECEQSGAACEVQVRQALNSKTCDSLGQGKADVVTFSGGEVTVGDGSLNQAYTCVKVQLDTADVKGELQADNGSFVTKLQGTRDFNQVRLSWFSENDLPELPDGTTATPEYTLTDPAVLPSHDTWSKRQPPILRSQLIQFSKGNIDLSSFNDSNTKNAKSLFLYPIDSPVSPAANFSSDTRRNSGSRNAPRPAPCKSNFATDAYLCQVTISLPAMPNREAYLQLAAYYNNASYKIELLDNGTVVPFDGVQPLVDSTGRASDLFRRVKASVSVSDRGAELPFPDAALTVEGNLCKDFFVTNKLSDYDSDPSRDGDCNPVTPGSSTPTPPIPPTTPPTPPIPPIPSGDVLLDTDFNSSTIANPMSAAQYKAAMGDSTLGAGASALARTSIVSASGHGNVIRQTFPANSYGSGQGIVTFPKLSKSVDEASIQYDIRFSNGFDWSLGGKLPGLGGAVSGTSPGTASGCNAGSSNAWSGRGMWLTPAAGYSKQNPKSPVEWIGYMYNPTKIDTCGDNVRTGKSFVAGQWHTVTQYYKMNTVGKSNGIHKMWFDGQEVVNDTSFIYRTNPNLHINYIFWAMFRGGSTSGWAGATNGSIDIDNLLITTP